LFCKELALNCTHVHKIIEYQLATTYLAISKQGTSPKLVEQLQRAAGNYKQSSDYQNMVEYWLTQFSQQSALSIHESEGIIKLWAQPTK
jgi:hypothetical protein